MAHEWFFGCIWERAKFISSFIANPLAGYDEVIPLACSCPTSCYIPHTYPD